MSFKLGNTNISELYVGSTKIGSAYLGSTKVYEGTAPGPTPIILPDYTIRLKFTEGVTPSWYEGTAVQVSSSPNIWDLTYNNSNWDVLLQNQSNLLEILGANTSNVTSMRNIFNYCSSLTDVSLFDTSNVTSMLRMFASCSSLTSVPLFNTSNVTDMSRMFYQCTSLTSIPLFNTSKVTTMSYMFNNCRNVESGALALYQQASSQTNPPSSHLSTFTNCGKNTTTGAVELAQIPRDWK